MLTHPSYATNGKIKFWTANQFDEWVVSADGQCANRGGEPFLEEENGDPVSEERVTQIKACMRGVFRDLVNKKLAPQVWGALCTTGQETFHLTIEKSFPLFMSAENGWKLDRLAWVTYPAWQSHHLNENLEWKTKDEKKKDRLKCKGTADLEESLPLKKIKRGNVFDSS